MHALTALLARDAAEQLRGRAVSEWRLARPRRGRRRLILVPWWLRPGAASRAALVDCDGA